MSRDRLLEAATDSERLRPPTRLFGRWPLRIPLNETVIGGTWLAGSQAVFALSTLLGVRLLSDAMPPAAYGEVGLLVGILTLSRNLIFYPLLQAAIRFYPEVLRQGKVTPLRRLIIFTLNWATAVLSLVVFLLGAASYGWKPSSILLLCLMVGLLFVDNLRGLESEFLLAAQRQRAFAIIRAGESFLRVVGAIVMVRWLGPAPSMVLLGYLLGGAAVYGGLFLFRIERIGVSQGVGSMVSREPLNRSLRDRIWRYSLPMMPMVLMDWISSLSDRYVVGGLVGLSAAGIYVAAYGLMAQPFLITQMTLEMMLRSRYFDAVSAGEAPRAREIFVSWVILQSVISLLGVVLITCLSTTLAMIFLGEQYQAAARIMPYLAAGNALLAVYMTLEKVFHARKQTTWCLTLRALGAALSLVIGVPLIWQYGVFGAALAVPLYYGLLVLACLAVLQLTRRTDLMDERTRFAGATL